ncbi:Cytosolic acyl coenzyme A thioester hydrolase [Varanus komodoensis]|nr:Cytosolic acyl coenzyme A thioester hydrolase [Varanus komodoensis]
MKLMDEVAGIVAARHCKTNIVTASVDAINFHEKIKKAGFFESSCRPSQTGVASSAVLVQDARGQHLMRPAGISVVLPTTRLRCTFAASGASVIGLVGYELQAGSARWSMGHVGSVSNRGGGGGVSPQTRFGQWALREGFARSRFSTVGEGSVITISGRMTFTSNKSMEIEVFVDADPFVDEPQERYRAVSAFFTYVSLSKEGRPLPVPQLVVETEDERRRFEEGKGRYLQTKAKRQAQMQALTQHIRVFSRLTGLIALQSKGLAGFSSSTTIQGPQFFGAQPSLWSSFHSHTFQLGKP